MIMMMMVMMMMKHAVSLTKKSGDTCILLKVARFYISPINPFAPGDFAEKRVLKLVEWFSGHCRAIKS